jgi:hypothetical protein
MRRAELALSHVLCSSCMLPRPVTNDDSFSFVPPRIRAQPQKLRVDREGQSHVEGVRITVLQVGDRLC